MIVVKVDIEICPLFCLRVFTVSLRRFLPQTTKTSLNLPTVFPSWQSALWGKYVKELYTNQRKFDFGANFAVFQIPV